VKAYVTIIEGCNEFCSFCVVPYTRGHERMRPKADILAEVREAADTGHAEVQLLGQIVNHYAAPDDPSCDFSGLLEAIHEIDGIERIASRARTRVIFAGVPRRCDGCRKSVATSICPCNPARRRCWRPCGAVTRATAISSSSTDPGIAAGRRARPI
jgi:hypothetical protein